MKSNSRQAALWAAAADVEENVRAVRRGRVVADLKQSGAQWHDSANKGAAVRRSLLEIDDKTGRIVVTEYPDDQYGPVIIDPVR